MRRKKLNFILLNKSHKCVQKGDILHFSERKIMCVEAKLIFIFLMKYMSVKKKKLNFILLNKKKYKCAEIKLLCVFLGENTDLQIMWPIFILLKKTYMCRKRLMSYF